MSTATAQRAGPRTGRRKDAAGQSRPVAPPVFTSDELTGLAHRTVWGESITSLAAELGMNLPAMNRRLLQSGAYPVTALCPSGSTLAASLYARWTAIVLRAHRAGRLIDLLPALDATLTSWEAELGGQP